VSGGISVNEIITPIAKKEKNTTIIQTKKTYPKGSRNTIRIIPKE
jgi:hypothetical protein